MTGARREIVRADVLAADVYAARRRELRREAMRIKRDRRMEVGPYATFYFENYDTMWHQVHEMLHIERGGEAQIAGELEAYNPLIPNGRELVATVMFEIDDPARRARVLARLGGVERTAVIELSGAAIAGRPVDGLERGVGDGRASSVQFLRFPFDPDGVEAFRRPEARVAVGFVHDAYGHVAAMPGPVRAALAGDFAAPEPG